MFNFVKHNLQKNSKRMNKIWTKPKRVHQKIEQKSTKNYKLPKKKWIKDPKKVTKARNFHRQIQMIIESQRKWKIEEIREWLPSAIVTCHSKWPYSSSFLSFCSSLTYHTVPNHFIYIGIPQILCE